MEHCVSHTRAVHTATYLERKVAGSANWYQLLELLLCSFLAPCTPVNKVLCQALEPTVFLVHSVLTAFAEDAVVAHSSATAHGNLPELCKRSSPIPQIMIFVFSAFTLSPFSSSASFQVKSLLTYSSSDSAMVTR